MSEEMMLPERSRRRSLGNRRSACLAGLLMAASLAELMSPDGAQAGLRQQYVPVLGVTAGESAVGTVTYATVIFEKRADRGGLAVHFSATHGRFSRMAQAAAVKAIARTALALGLSPDSWTVHLSVPHPDITIDGNSLSAMIGLAVAALAKDEAIPHGRAITGTVTEEGRIGAVGGVGLKLAAAHEARLHMVLVPEGDLVRHDKPGLSVSAVGSVHQAYQLLTGARRNP